MQQTRPSAAGRRAPQWSRRLVAWLHRHCPRPVTGRLHRSGA